MQATLSLNITVWTHPILYREGEPEVPDKEIFNQTVTDEPFVRDVQDQLAGLQRGVRGFHIMVETTYLYTFRFASDGVTTQVYWGDIGSAAWQVTTGEHERTESVLGAMNAQLYGFNLLTTLHQRTGMPLPDWWHTESLAPETDS